MAKAKSRTTPNRGPRHEPADDWRQHQLRRRARGAGKYPLPAGRYSTIKQKLSGDIVARPALTMARIEALEELCVLTSSTTGFCYTPAMERACEAIADKIGPAARLAYLARASKRERLEIFA